MSPVEHLAGAKPAVPLRVPFKVPYKGTTGLQRFSEDSIRA